MKSGFDISRIDGDGYLILPLSMSRLATGQSPEVCYEIIQYFTKKLSTFSNDVIFLYTNGLYMNSNDVSFSLRQRLNQQVLQHSIALRTLLEKKKEFIPGAFHFLPIDYVILNSPVFQSYLSTLKKHEKEDENFRLALQQDTFGREYTEANVSFLLEEIVVEHIVRQNQIDFPRTLVRNDVWRLVVYPGGLVNGSLYQWSQNLLPKQKTANPYAGAVYDYNEKKLLVFDELVPG